MTPFDSVATFRRRQDELKAALDPDRKVVTLCGGTGCGALGSADVYEAFRRELDERGLTETIGLKRTGCHGFCEQGPVLVILPEKVFYPNVQPEDVPEIVEKTLLQGKLVKRLLYVDPATGRKVSREHDVPFYAKQQRSVFRFNGVLDPVDLEDYIARDGYAAVAKALAEMTPEQVVEEVLASGLRGRGGAGFPTGRKWQFARAARGGPKYLICNADEGDPGAFMDRSLLEGAPHAVLEGMVLAAYAIGASHGIIYVRAEYPLAVQHTQTALRQAREAGLLGPDLLGTGFAFDVEIHQGAGAFVCGEETALIASLESERGMPRPRPPFPATSGYRECPTIINNVETLSNVPLIVLNGGESYATVGTDKSKGTKIFALAGKVTSTGLVEVPMGTTLREIIFDIGGGVPRGRKFKAAQMGGPSGGCVPAQYLDMPIDYDSVQEVGAIMGSGGLIVMDEATCMVDIARFFTDFCAKESCGKCAPCRIGTKRMLEVLEKICRGEGEMEDLDRLEDLGRTIRDASLCGLGQTAANPVLSTLRHFRDEYVAHIKENRCPSHACEALSPITCRSACPAHVNIPEYVALIAEGRFADALDVIRRRNPLASVCGRACHHPCELFCRRGDVDEPVAIRHLKRFASDRVKQVGEPPQWQGPRRGRVAVVGSGPAGLTAAYFLALMGREVKVFESLDTVGGMLAVGVPQYRLPREALERDVEYIRRAGVEIVTGHRVESIKGLREEGFDAIFVAAGAHESYALDIPGEELEGVHDAIAFLRRAALGELDAMSGRVVVIGGGNAAIDAARTALRLGAESVTILYRRTRDEMPAIRDEIDDAVMEGVDIHLLVSPLAIEGDGRVRAIRCAEMELGEADASGRRRPIPKPGCERVFETDHVIVAVGQAPELDFAAIDGGLVVKRGKAVADPVTQESAEGVFVGGDAVTGPATIIEAIAAGQRAAMAIDRLLGGKGELPPDHGWAAPGKPEPDESEEASRRRPIRQRSARKRRGNFEEVVKGYSLQAACSEARRCLRCDLEQ